MGKPQKNILSSFNEYFLIGLFVATIGVLTLQVIARTFFSTAFPWVEEVARYLFVYFVFGGAALAFRNGVFISVDLVGRFLPKNVQFVLQVAIDIFILFFFVMVSCIGTELFLGSTGQLTPALEMEIRYVYLAFPIFFIQMSFYAASRIYTFLKHKKA